MIAAVMLMTLAVMGLTTRSLVLMHEQVRPVPVPVADGSCGRCR